MPIQSRLGNANRILAFVLAGIWLCAGLAAIAIGVVRERWVIGIAGLFALGYAMLWLRVAARRRLLTWAELVLPWRTG